MHTTKGYPDLHPILRNADRAAGRFCLKHGGPLLEQEDVRQDLLLDLLIRLKAFDPARSSLAFFAAICFRHRSARMAGAARRDRLARHPVALDAPLPGSESLSLKDVIAEADGYGAWIGQPVNGVIEIEEQLDLDRILTTLPADAVPLCAVLMGDESDSAGVAGVSRTTLHRHVVELRCRMLAGGATPRRGTNRRVGG